MADVIDLKDYVPQKGKVLPPESKLLYTLQGLGTMWLDPQTNANDDPFLVTEFIYQNGEYGPDVTYTVYQEAMVTTPMHKLGSGVTCVCNPDFVQMELITHFAATERDATDRDFSCTQLGLEQLFTLLPSEMFKRAVSSIVSEFDEADRTYYIKLLAPLVRTLMVP